MTIVHRSPLAHRVIGCAMAVHAELGPGLTEAPYGRGFGYELNACGLSYRSELVIPIVYKGVQLDCGYRADFMIEDQLLVEIKSVEHLLPVHSAQVMSYLKLTKVPQALLFNFNVNRLKEGMKSFLFREGKIFREEELDLVKEALS